MGALGRTGSGESAVRGEPARCTVRRVSSGHLRSLDQPALGFFLPNMASPEADTQSKPLNHQGRGSSLLLFPFFKPPEK